MTPHARARAPGMFRRHSSDLAVLGLFLVVAPATTSTSASGSSPAAAGCGGTAALPPPLPLAANYSRVSYGGTGATVVLRYTCQEGYHLYGEGVGDRVEECGGGAGGGGEIPSVCALDATRHEWTDVTLSSGYFPEKSVDDDDSGIHKGKSTLQA